MAKFEIAIRQYDRTPEGNIPYIYSVECESEFGALALAYIGEEPKGIISDKQAEELLRKNGWEEDDDVFSVQGLIDNIEDYDPSDAFVFYIKNLDTGELIIDNVNIEKWMMDEFEDDPVEKGSEFDLKHPYLHDLLNKLDLYVDDETEEDESLTSNTPDQEIVEGDSNNVNEPSNTLKNNIKDLINRYGVDNFLDALENSDKYFLEDMVDVFKEKEFKESIEKIIEELKNDIIHGTSFLRLYDMFGSSLSSRDEYLKYFKSHPDTFDLCDLPDEYSYFSPDKDMFVRLHGYNNQGIYSALHSYIDSLN